MVFLANFGVKPISALRSRTSLRGLCSEKFTFGRTSLQKPHTPLFILEKLRNYDGRSGQFISQFSFNSFVLFVNLLFFHPFFHVNFDNDVSTDACLSVTLYIVFLLYVCPSTIRYLDPNHLMKLSFNAVGSLFLLTVIYYLPQG